MLSKILFMFLFVLGFAQVQAQSYKVSGRVADAYDSLALNGASIFLCESANVSQCKTMLASNNGHFAFTEISEGNYILKVIVVGYDTLQQPVKINTDLDLGFVPVTPQTIGSSVRVKAQRNSVTQSGDTIQYSSSSFKTNPDATAEDMINKMPGVSSSGGTVKVNGDDVKQILIDGKPYFGDDPNLVLKNLPAEVIEKIQVYDRMSDQAQFTGFDDGNSGKTINIVTKSGLNNGQFGKIYAGYGDDERYLAGGNTNYFKGNRRISIIGMSNNINQQNFSSQDLIGLTDNAGGSGGGRGGRGGGGYGGGMQGGNMGGSDNFLVGQQGGVALTNSLGINYADKWGKKITISGSYFLNTTKNTNLTSLNRNFIVADSSYSYMENSETVSRNYNHRTQLRVEYNIDSSNSIIFTPRFSLQNNSSDAFTDGSSFQSSGELENKTDNNNHSKNTGYNFNQELLYRHRFQKKGRTFSASFGLDANYKSGNRKFYSRNIYYAIEDTVLIDQYSDQLTTGKTYSVSLNYTEPVGEKSQVQFSYRPSYTINKTDKETNNLDGVEYTDLDTLLTNRFDNMYMYHRAGIAYRYNLKDKMNFSAGVDGQHSHLVSDQTFPSEYSLDRTFLNVMPNAMFNYKFSAQKNLRIRYRTTASPPSVTQLQNVIDNRNPLLLKTGNPSLRQDFSHNIMMRFGSTQAAKSKGYFWMVSGSYVQNYIGNSSLYAVSDTVTADGIELNKGSQLSRPVNLNGYWNARTFFTWFAPVKKIKSNFNTNSGITYSHTPAEVNGQINIANTTALSQGLVLSSNISTQIDFTLSYTANYSIVRNSLQTNSDYNYFSQLTSFRINWILQKKFVMNTNFNHTLYGGLSESFNRSYFLWNASVGYKALKDQSLEFRLTVFDLLNQNNSISRVVTETSVEDNRTNVLNRYFMLVVTYTFRNFTPKNEAKP